MSGCADLRAAWSNLSTPCVLHEEPVVEARLALLEPDLFERRRPWIGIDEHERGVLHAGGDPARADAVVDGGEAHAGVALWLDLREPRRARLRIQHLCLVR